GPQHTEPVDRVPPRFFVLDSHLVGRAAFFGRPVDDLVIDVGDVRDMAHVEPSRLEIATEDVVHQHLPAVADVGHIVDSGSADIHRDPSGLALVELPDLGYCGVEEADHATTVTA